MLELPNTFSGCFQVRYGDEIKKKTRLSKLVYFFANLFRNSLKLAFNKYCSYRHLLHFIKNE